MRVIRDPYWAERGTTAAIQVQNRILLATNNPDATMPSEWQGLLRSGEKFVGGAGHAEETILNSITDESEIVAGGTSRNVCIATCAPLIDKAGLELGGPQFPGSLENTPYRMFWRNLQ